MTRFLAILVAMAAAGSAHADCAMSGLLPQVLTPAGTVVPGEGGIVVAAVENGRGKLDPGDAAIVKGWKVKIGNDTLTPPITSIAPGLAVYRVNGANAYDAKLLDGGAVLATVKPARRAGDAMPAPKVGRISYNESRGRHGGSSVGVALGGDVPAGAVALVLADANGAARSWVLAPQGATQLFPYHNADCTALPNGTVASRAGDKVTLFWLGADGRVSPSTIPVTIAPK